MRHAGPEALGRLSDLLGRLRTLEGLAERTPGTFYRKSRAFLHFHEDPTGLFADVRLNDDFERRPVTTAAEQDELFSAIVDALS